MVGKGLKTYKIFRFIHKNQYKIFQYVYIYRRTQNNNIDNELSNITKYVFALFWIHNLIVHIKVDLFRIKIIL